MWVSKVVVFTALLGDGGDGVRDILVQAVEDMKDAADGGEICTPPVLAPVEAEWTGYRANVDSQRPRPDLTEAQHYERLMAEVKSDITILYFHGGAFFLMDPATHRDPTSHIAKLTGGRVLSIRYRLAPQHAFPSALLDALIAYLSLLYPPPGSYHSAVPAFHIAFSGDSAGGGLCLALVQLLLQINRSSSPGQTISFHGHTVTLPLPLPAGCATQSPWIDMTRSMPSVNLNAEYDYLPPPLTREKASTFPHCDVWPTDPPRGDLYCDVSMLCHPLVSPVAAKDWSGSCPLFFAYGEEMLADETQVVAARASRQGVRVIAEQWEAMPHCFAMIFLGSPMSKKCFTDLTNFCKVVVKGVEPETRGLWIAAKTQKETEVEVERLAVIGDDDLEERMKRAREARDLGLEGEAKILPKL